MQEVENLMNELNLTETQKTDVRYYINHNLASGTSSLMELASQATRRFRR